MLEDEGAVSLEGEVLARRARDSGSGGQKVRGAMSEPETLEGLGRSFAEIAAEAKGYIEEHRASCPRHKLRLDCDDCKFYRCACGNDADYTPTLLGTKRPAMCEDCRAAWELREQFAGALATIPEKWQAIRLHSPELAAYVTGYGANKTRVQVCLDSTMPAILRGPSGAGKTTLACAMMHELIDRAMKPAATSLERERARKTFFVSELDLFKASKTGKTWEGDSALVTRAMKSSVLILDDLGQKSEERATVVTEIIEERYRKTLPTWVTTFLTSDEITRFYGGGTWRRLGEAKQFILLGAQGGKP